MNMVIDINSFSKTQNEYVYYYYLHSKRNGRRLSWEGEVNDLQFSVIPNRPNVRVIAIVVSNLDNF